MSPTTWILDPDDRTLDPEDRRVLARLDRSPPPPPPAPPPSPRQGVCALPRCGRVIALTHGRRFCCHDHAKLARTGSLCTGGCGRLMWAYAFTDRLDGKWDRSALRGLCHACRRARRAKLNAASAFTPELRTCACGVIFWTRQRSQIWCSRLCRARESYRRRDGRRAERARFGHRYRVLRARVAAEEFWCWRCWQPIDYARIFPDPWCFTLDHVRPLVQGGDEYDRDNARAAHLRCNVSAGTEQYRSRRRALPARI